MSGSSSCNAVVPARARGAGRQCRRSGAAMAQWEALPPERPVLLSRLCPAQPPSWAHPHPGQAVLFALRDPPPAPPPPPPALGPPGLGEGALGLGPCPGLGLHVVLAAVGAPVGGRAQGGRVLVLLAEGIGAQVAEGGRGLAAHVTVMPRAHPLPCKRRPLADTHRPEASRPGLPCPPVPATARSPSPGQRPAGLRWALVPHTPLRAWPGGKCHAR